MSNLFMDMHHKRFRNTPSHRSVSNASSTDTSITKLPTVKNGNTETPEDDDEFDNVLSLQLRKPKHWKWELTTSRSCSNIALPRILLYDHKGTLLIDADSQTEQTFREGDLKRSRAASRKRSSSRSATTNLEQSIRKALDREFDGLQIKEATPSSTLTANGNAHTIQSIPSSLSSNSAATVDFYTNELPDYTVQRRASSLRGVRFNVADNKKDSTTSLPLVDLCTPPSTGTATTPTTSSSSGPREKRRYRRSRSSGRSPGNSSSILERFSFNKGRFSSPEYAEEEVVYRPPRYFLRTSKAGTLVVQEESFSRYRRRHRRPKSSSNENIQSEYGSKGSLKSDGGQKYLQVTDNVASKGRQCASLQNIAEVEEHSQKRVFPVRRYRSDGNVLLNTVISTSEEEYEQKEGKPKFIGSPRYSHIQRHHKKDLVSIDPNNEMLAHAMGSPTSR